MKFALLLLSTALATFAAQPAPTLKAAVVIGAKDEIKLGTLTVGEKQLDFEGADLLFALPLDAVEDVQVAGFREKWLSIGIRANSEFGKSYSFLLQSDRAVKNAPARVQFLLPPNADLKSAVALAQAFKARADALVAQRQASEQATKAQEGKEKQQQRQQAEAVTVAPPPVPSPASKHRDVAPQKLRTLLVVQAYYLARKPGGFVNSYGLVGELVFRQDGIGFTFAEPGKLDSERQQAADGGAIWIPAATATGTLHKQKGLLGGAPTMFWVGFTPRQGSPAADRLRPLLTEAGEVLFTIRQTGAQNRIADLLTEYNTANFGGNEQ